MWMQVLFDSRSITNWHKSVKDQRESEGHDLLASLIIPVQRILRYKLLLEVPIVVRNC